MEDAVAVGCFKIGVCATTHGVVVLLILFIMKLV